MSLSEEMTQEIVSGFRRQCHVYPIENCGHSPLIDDLEQLTNRN